MTVQSSDGDIPHGRELSLAWLAGTVMTGLTSVLLMGAALYVSFQGQDTFSTAYAALQIEAPKDSVSLLPVTKTDRVRPVAQTRSEREMVGASIRDEVEGRAIIHPQSFVRIKATLATGATALSEDIPAYDPVALLNETQPLIEDVANDVNTDIYGAEVEGEVEVTSTPLTPTFAPAALIDDQAATDFVRGTIEGDFGGGDFATLAYASTNESIRDLGTETTASIAGIAENVTSMPKSHTAEDAGLGISERIVTLREPSPLEETLKKNGFSPLSIGALTKTLTSVYPSTNLVAGTRLRILFGPSRSGDTLIPYRLSIYLDDKPIATVALTDRGQYVLGLPPPPIDFPKEDVEEINVNNLPTLYRSLWETGRKHDLPDNTIERIVAMFAYDLDLNKRISAGDSIEILETPPDADGHQELLHVGLKLGSVGRDVYRFRADDGTVEYYDQDGQTGKRFLSRRPLQGGGIVRSGFGYRKHPVFGNYRLHTGVDLAAPYKTPIYAAGDGVVERAQWESGYGRYILLKHVNGFETGYGHMSGFADGVVPGTRVRQGQLIGYVGSTGVSTGNHLHFEIKINGRFVDPLSVKLPRDKVLPPQYQTQFAETVAQIKHLMELDPAPVKVASK